MSNKVYTGDEARAGLLKGINILADAVESSQGPRGRNTAIDLGYMRKVIHDGVGIGRAIQLEDPVENFGAQILLEAAKKQVQTCGDGTTVTIAIARAIIVEAEKLIKAGVNPMELRRGLEDGIEKLIEEIKTYSTPIKTLQDKIDVATISAEDKDLGILIAETIDKLGEEGVITVEESKGAETFVDHQEGMQFDKGWANPFFVTNPDTNEATLTDTNVLVTDKIIDVNIMLPFFRDLFEKRSEPLVIIGGGMQDSLRDFLVINKLQGKIRAFFVNAPLSADKGQEFLADIATLVGATFIGNQAGMELKDVTYAQLGKAERITSTATATIIVGGKGNKTDIDERVTSIKARLEQEESDFEKEKYRERLAKLTNGVAVVKVGGQTEVEMNERKERADDAVHSLQAALKGGIVPGGEIVYLSASRVLGDSYADRILKEAIKRPFSKLVENAGFNSGQMLERLHNTVVVPGVEGFGIDVTTGETVNMLEKGIIDPLLVVENALRNALSVAIPLMTTENVIVPIKEEVK